MNSIQGATNGTNLLGTTQIASNLLGTTGTSNLLGTTGTSNLLGTTTASNLLDATSASNLFGTTGASNLLGTTGTGNLKAVTQPVTSSVNLFGDTPAANTSLVIVTRHCSTAINQSPPPYIQMSAVICSALYPKLGYKKIKRTKHTDIGIMPSHRETCNWRMIYSTAGSIS